MGTVRLVVPALLFLAYYISVMLTCGLVTWKLEINLVDGGRDATDYSEDFATSRNAVASFLIGTGFAPFVIGLLQGLFLFVAPGLNQQAYAVVHAVLPIFALFLMRRQLAIFLQQFLNYVRGWKWLAVIFLTLILSSVTYYALQSAIRPLKAYDATVYALDARRLAQTRSLQGLMTWSPDEDNQLTNHNHGSSYQLFLSTALIFGREPRQDFPLRVAQQLCSVHVFLCLIGIGLRVSGIVGLLAPTLLLSNFTYEYTIYQASRDPYRLLAMLLVLGFVGVRNTDLCTKSRCLLLLLSFIFLWNSHAVSLMIAPTIFASIFIFYPGWKSKGAVFGVFILALLLGGSSLLKTYVITGDPTTDSFVIYKQYEDTPLLDSYFKNRKVFSPGTRDLAKKIRRQFQEDGSIIVLTLWVSLVVVPIWSIIQALRRRRHDQLPTLVMVMWLFLLVFELQVAGLFDWIDGRISSFLAMNLRYRLSAYPFAAFLGGWVIALGIGFLGAARKKYVAMAIILLFFLSGIGSIRRHWRLCCDNIPILIDSNAGDSFMATRIPFWEWMETFKSIPRDELVLTERAYDAWYHIDNRVMAMHDPRLRQVNLAKQPERAVALLDHLGIRFVCLSQERLNLIAASAFGQALNSEAFELFDTKGRWRIFRRSGSDQKAMEME
jgi:hypothetical protein